MSEPRTADEPTFETHGGIERAYCSVCNSSVWPENWPNHILGKYHRRRAASPIRQGARVLRVTEEPDRLRAALDSALTELDNIRWDDIWPHLYGGSESSQELARMSIKYVGYVRADIEKARAALAAKDAER